MEDDESCDCLVLPVVGEVNSIQDVPLLELVMTAQRADSLTQRVIWTTTLVYDTVPLGPYPRTNIGRTGVFSIWPSKGYSEKQRTTLHKLKVEASAAPMGPNRYMGRYHVRANPVSTQEINKGLWFCSNNTCQLQQVTLCYYIR